MPFTVGHLIGMALKHCGVPYITGLPGHGNWNPLDAFNDPDSSDNSADGVDTPTAEHRRMPNSRWPDGPGFATVSSGRWAESADRVCSCGSCVQ